MQSGQHRSIFNHLSAALLKQLEVIKYSKTRQSALGELLARWNELVGELSKDSIPQSIKGDILEVSVRSALVRSALKRLEPQLIARAQDLNLNQGWKKIRYTRGRV